MTVNPDLQKERDSATFDVEKLTEVLYNGKEMVKRRRYLQNLVFQDKFFKTVKPWWNQERIESYDAAVKKGVYVNKLCRDHNVTEDPEMYYIREAAACQEGNPLGIQLTMFVPTIEKQGTQEQIEKYAVPARQFKIIGTYAQTEIGHGTFIRGLETTATYDPKTEEFVINSPTVSSTKYWPAALGRTANHVVLIAQLYSQGKCHGIHSFIIQIRSLKDNSLFPGIAAGDIGNKLGFNSVDNGYLAFNNYRISRDSMLMRYAKVEKDGTYKRLGDSRIAYGTMVFVRAKIVTMTGYGLSQAVTIATRYSAVRRQTELKPGGEEPQVLDYQTQQEKIFPLIAASYAFFFTGDRMVQEYKRINADMEKGLLAEMPSLHALAAGLKAFLAEIASNGIDKVRMACGGHGYSHASGIPKIWENITPACTYEGENTVMYLQCARYLVKQYADAARGTKLAGIMTYLNQPIKRRSDLNGALRLDDFIEAFEHVAARLVGVAAMRLQTLMRGGAAIETARNNSSVSMVRAAKAHCQLYVVKTFINVLKRRDLDPSVAKVMTTMCKLYAVCGINERLGDFLQDGFLTGSQAETVSNKMVELFAELRPNSVALVDAFDYHDQVLQSCLGRYDGNVYDALYEYSKNSPLNDKDACDTFQTTLLPLMKGELNYDTMTAKL